MKCCAASSARVMRRLRGCAPRASSERLAALELRLALGKEGGHALAEVLGVEAGVALVVFRLRKRPRVGEPAHEFLVPARGKRRAVGDASSARIGFFNHFAIGRDAVDQALLVGFPRPPDAPLEEYLERARAADEIGRASCRGRAEWGE